MLKCIPAGEGWVAEMLREIWGRERWEQWTGISEELKVAEWLGFRIGCSDRQKGIVVEFLEWIDRKGSDGLEQPPSGQSDGESGGGAE